MPWIRHTMFWGPNIIWGIHVYYVELCIYVRLSNYLISMTLIYCVIRCLYGCTMWSRWTLCTSNPINVLVLEKSSIQKQKRERYKPNILWGNISAFKVLPWQRSWPWMFGILTFKIMDERHFFNVVCSWCGFLDVVIPCHPFILLLSFV